MDLQDRIAQFEQLVKEDPTSDITYFSLGNAYAEAGRHQDAATSYERCIALNMNMSRAYQLAAEQYIALGENEKALRQLNDGFEIARRNGDMKVKEAMEQLFAQLGAEAPKEETIDPAALPDGSFICARSKRPGHKMHRPPFKGPVGHWIGENISKETWDEWIKQGTKVINELRLDLSKDEDSDTYDRYMREYLGITDELLAELSAKS
ncbi:MAG: Fe(2+)-trafficking protein [Phycisphaerales bacterium JB050]